MATQGTGGAVESPTGGQGPAQDSTSFSSPADIAMALSAAGMQCLDANTMANDSDEGTCVLKRETGDYSGLHVFTNRSAAEYCASGARPYETFVAGSNWVVGEEYHQEFPPEAPVFAVAQALGGEVQDCN